MGGRRAVITGLGAVTPLANSIDGTFRAMLRGQVGIGPITRFKAEGLSCQVAGELKGFRATDFIPKKDAMRLDPFVHYAAAAALMATEDAGLVGADLSGAGVLVGSSRGGIGSLEQAMTGRATAYLMPATTISMGASYVSMMMGARGPVLGISNACASGANAVGEAMRLVLGGECEVVLAGGAEAPLTPICIKGYGAAGALSAKGCMVPFDARRDGFVLAEGAAVLVVEELARAEARGARVYAELTGYGNTSDAAHQTVPDSAGQVAAMRAARKQAGAGQVDYVSAHATATRVGDATEAGSINEALGGADVPVSAVKSMTGHMLGASGALQAALLAMCIHRGVILPTVGLTEPDCDLRHVSRAAKLRINMALSNSFGFGGVNAVLALGRP